MTRRWWYLAAVSSLVVALFVVWWDPFPAGCKGELCNNSASGWGMIVLVGGFVVALVLAFIGTVRDPP